MKTRRPNSQFFLLWVWACLAPLGLAGADGLKETSARSPGEEVIDFALIDHRGRFHELRRTDARAVVLFFTGNGCPIARQSIWKLRALRAHYLERGVDFWMINSNPQDDRASIAQEAEAFRSEPLPVLKDDTQGVARMLGVNRTCETIAISAKDWRIFYRGAIDGQLSEGPAKFQPGEKLLETALEEFLAGKTVSKAQTLTKGCRIQFGGEGAGANSQISFAREVAPILARKCVMGRVRRRGSR